MKLQLIATLLFLMMSFGLVGQIRYADSVYIEKQWDDKNGANKLQIKVKAACNILNDDAPVDGFPTAIEVGLQNKNHLLSMTYNHENYPMQMILFLEEGIWYRDINGIKAVFIPFFYCGNMNSDMRLSYIVLYDNKKYLYHFDYYCELAGREDQCVFNEERGLNRKLKAMPSSLSKVFIDYIESNYKTVDDLFPTHESFLNPKFR